MEYLRWAKLHRRVRFELTGSGVPPNELADFDAKHLPISLQVRGAYGDPDLIQAISRRYGFPDKGVVPVPGASSANFITLAAATRPGDSVMLEQPVYEPISRAASFLGRRVIPLLRSPERAFTVRLEDVAQGLNQGARAVFLTNLHNPSGQLLTQDAVEQIAGACARAGATLIVDEVYLDAAHLNGDQPRWTAATVADNIIAINSLTKVYGLGGLRVGWLLANPDLAERAREIMDLLSVENAAPSAAIALRAFAGLERLEARYRSLYREGQPIYRRWLDGEPLVQGYASHGAVFECVRLPAGLKSDDLNGLLVGRHDTQVVPGSFFGLDDHIRANIGHPPEELDEALTRISRALRELLARTT